MTVTVKAPVDSSIVNDAFVSKITDSTMVSLLTLANTIGASGATIVSVQKYINQIAAAAGVVGEDDTASNTYTQENYITNGDAYKIAINLLDIALKVRQDNIDTNSANITINTQAVTSDVIAASGTITPNTTTKLQFASVQGNAAPITLANEPFGVLGGFLNGLTISVVGLDGTNTVKMNRQDIQYGALINGSVTLGQGNSITLLYVTAIERFIEVARNF